MDLLLFNTGSKRYVWGPSSRITCDRLILERGEEKGSAWLELDDSGDRPSSLAHTPGSRRFRMRKRHAIETVSTSCAVSSSDGDTPPLPSTRQCVLRLPSYLSHPRDRMQYPNL